jgi:membrane-anchored protein YejM (alkaline phosphatase superfamily)
LLSLWPFVVIVVLTGFIMVPNALYGFRHYLAHRNLIWLAAYFILLFSFAFLVLHVTRRTVEIVAQAKEVLLQPDS